MSVSMTIRTHGQKSETQKMEGGGKKAGVKKPIIPVCSWADYKSQATQPLQSPPPSPAPVQYL